MFSISGYRTMQQVYESEQSLIFRATRERDGLPVILKLLKDVHPPPERIARFKREFQLIKELNLLGIAAVYDFMQDADHWIIVQEDFGGESLARLGLAGRIDIGTFLSLAVSIVDHLAGVHEAAVIHKDLNPANIVYNPKTRSVKLIDFGIATRLARETVDFDHPSRLEGTPAYISPEQTGRMNQPLDERSDLYALGCTFYELLTGRTPFEATDVVELMHCHLARVPDRVHVRRSDVPLMISEIIAKLLAKNARERYQTARGLHTDLIRCRDESSANGSIVAFPLAKYDVTKKLSPPARLYGRGTEIADLLGAFEHVAAGSTEIVLVSGHPGIGKSALVKEVYRPVTAKNGLFAAGKFNQYQRDVPYAAIVEALDGLITHILMEPAENVASWAKRLQTIVGDMLAPLVELLPRLELLYERVPPRPSLPTAEFNFRFVRVLASFIRAFARPEHPLVLFIDDLQWADRASTELLKHLLSDVSSPFLMFVGAYRDNDALAVDALNVWLDEIRENGISLHDLHLDALDEGYTTELLADTFHCSKSEAKEPAEIVYQKTAGNPFFIQILLNTLVDDGIVYFSRDLGRFHWYVDRLRQLDSSDNVVDLVVANMQKLPVHTRDLLTQAACIGSRFELGILAASVGSSAAIIAEALLPALRENYLLPTTGDYRLFEAGVENLPENLGFGVRDAADDLKPQMFKPDITYKFAHDRIQQAAYGLAPSGTHAAHHLRIGRGMMAHYTGRSAEARVLAMVDQFRLARDLIDDATERKTIAVLACQASQKAKASVADAAAVEYAHLGLELLGDQARQDRNADEERPSAATYERAFAKDYALALALTETAAAGAYGTADFKALDQHVDAISKHARHTLDRAKALEIRIGALGAQQQLVPSIALAREMLGLLGVELPIDPTEEDIDRRLSEVEHELGGRKARELAELPELTASEPAAALRVLDSMYIVAYLCQPKLAFFVSAEMVSLSLRHGFVEQTISGYLAHGMSLCTRGIYELGNEFGRAAEILMDRHQYKSPVPNLAAFGRCYIFHWRRPNREAIPILRNAYAVGVESGNIGSGCNCLQGATSVGYWVGIELSQIDEEYTSSRRILEKHKQGPFVTWLRQYHQAVRNFRGLNDDPVQLRGDLYDEYAEMPLHQQYGDMTAIYSVHWNKAMLNYHFHCFANALACARECIGGNQPGSILTPIATLYHCLAALAVYGEAKDEEKPGLLEEAKTLVLRMKTWAEGCAANHAHKYHLMAAELCRVSGEYKEAREHYDLAIDLARKHEYTHEEALALERAAMFYLGHKNTRLAGYYMRDAHYVFGRWGAEAKRKFLRGKYGYLLERETTQRSRINTQTKSTATKKTTTTTSELGEFDLGTVLAATRAIARETDVRLLLQTVMRVSLENAGAERGSLMLARNDKLIVKVRGEIGEERRFDWLSLALGDDDGVARSVVQYVARTFEPVVLDNAAESGMFTADPYIKASRCKSILCIPILNQGSLVAISYLENNHAASVFNEDRLDTLTLLMGQAAISIENALLKESDDTREFHFRVGGSLPANSSVYVRRKADELLVKKVREGEFCYVFNTRQMGKSSLRVRIADALTKADVACVSIDITAIGAQGVTIEQWYAGIARSLVNGLGLQKDFDLRKWWREKSDLSAVQRLDVLVDEVLLVKIDKNIAIFIDEIDAVLGMDLPLDDFFALIRLFYNRRAEDARYQRLSIVLLGVATPTDLIRDKRRTPFNIGQAIPLSSFRFDEAKSLLPGFATIGDAVEILKAVLHWSGGQPFLTQKLCKLISESETRPVEGKEREWVKGIVQERIIDNWRHHDDPEHLKTIEMRILRGTEDPVALLRLYRPILEKGEMDAGQSSLEATLLLSGLVIQAFDKLHVANPIYAAVFGREWIDQCLAGSSMG